jgi:hypothetical protein
MTEKADKALSSIDPTKMGNDMYSIGILMSELATQKTNLENAINSDSYKRVKVSENIIADLCEAINKLRR